jgi:hypothetical protein
MWQFLPDLKQNPPCPVENGGWLRKYALNLPVCGGLSHLTCAGAILAVLRAREQQAHSP